MKNYGICAFSVLLIITVLSNEANALHCWHCSSDATGGEFCTAESFKGDSLTSTEKHNSYVECIPEEAPTIRPACKKLTERINGRLVVKRSCFYEDKNDSSKHCNNSTKNAAPPDVEVLFCETCLTDGCNGASEFAPVATISLIPVFIAKLLAW